MIFVSKYDNIDIQGHSSNKMILDKDRFVVPECRIVDDTYYYSI